VTGNVLADKGGHLALYSSGRGPEDKPHVRSYVAWGRPPGQILSDAINARRWQEPTASVKGTNWANAWAGSRILNQNYSIGLMPNINTNIAMTERNWGIFADSEISPGQTNQGKRGPMPGAFTPDGNATDSKGFAPISVVPIEGENVQYEFQICRDQTCQQIVEEHTGNHFGYVNTKPIPPETTYFWRARIIYGDRTKSQWSKSFGVVNPNPKR
jgi:hypothetical protein